MQKSQICEGADDDELDEIGENLKAKVVSYTTNYVPTEVDHVGGSSGQKRKFGKLWTRFEEVNVLQMRCDGTRRKRL